MEALPQVMSWLQPRKPTGGGKPDSLLIARTFLLDAAPFYVHYLQLGLWQAQPKTTHTCLGL
jgi:hypothetical protein